MREEIMPTEISDGVGSVETYASLYRTKWGATGVARFRTFFALGVKLLNLSARGIQATSPKLANTAAAATSVW